MKQFTVQIRGKSISQLITGISRVVQKLLKDFNGTIISTSFVPWLPVLLATFSLNLIEKPLSLIAGKSLTAPAIFKIGSSLLYWNKLPDVFD